MANSTSSNSMNNKVIGAVILFYIIASIVPDAITAFVNGFVNLTFTGKALITIVPLGLGYMILRHFIKN